MLTNLYIHKIMFYYFSNNFCILVKTWNYFVSRWVLENWRCNAEKSIKTGQFLPGGTESHNKDK